jgi:hypothetical protein
MTQLGQGAPIMSAAASSSSSGSALPVALPAPIDHDLLASLNGLQQLLAIKLPGLNAAATADVHADSTPEQITELTLSKVLNHNIRRVCVLFLFFIQTVLDAHLS